MDFKPETFSIGVIDFFSVMLPGAALTGVLMQDATPVITELFPQAKHFGNVENWTVFLFFSYLLGHFVFLVGSYLDDLIYDRIRRATPSEQEKRAAKDEPLAWWSTRKLARLFFGKNPDLAVEQVIKSKVARLPDVDGKPVVNAFQWAKSRLTIQCPLALTEVQRLEADSKFFRSIVVVLALFIPWICFRSEVATQSWAGISLKLWLAGFGILLWLLSCWRYIERRFKATQQAYWHVITLDRCLPTTLQTERS